MGASSASVELNALLAGTGLEPLNGETVSRFDAYVSLFLRWNQRLNLSSVRDKKGVLTMHLIESIAVACALPRAIATLLDFGSGAGLPGIPIALCRPKISVTLAESQGKKAAFLEEAVRVLEISAKVHAGRAETLRQVFDCVVLRAVDKMPKAVAAAVQLVGPEGWLALMTTDAGLPRLQAVAGASFSWADPVRMPFSESRLLALAQRTSS